MRPRAGWNQAIPLFERTLADCERVLGADHPDTLARGTTSRTPTGGGGLDQAIPLYERTLADRSGYWAPTTRTRSSRGTTSRRLPGGGPAGAGDPAFERTLADRERVLGADHPQTRSPPATTLRPPTSPTGRLDQAIPLYERTLADR